MSSFVSHGMDPAEVQGTGKFLQSKAAEMEMLIRDINSRVSGSTWNGPDAEKFKNQWWPGHRRSLQGISKDLHGLGQSALNNAEEQLQASGGRSSSGGSAIGGGTSPGGGAAPGSSGGAGAIGSGRGSGLVPGWFKPDPNREYAWQCVDWVKKRRANLGLPVARGNGWELAGNSGGSVDTPPSFGAIASYGNGHAGSYGHTMIVEEVLDGGNRIRVSEMNTGIDGSGAAIGNPEEFRSDSYFVKTANGWVREGGRNVGPITFAT